MIYGSVCSGIEAASVAWEPLGWSPAFFSEIGKFPCQVLAHRFGSNMPNEPLQHNGIPNLGDMNGYDEWGKYPIDLLVGGTPCQDFSIAGLRAGLAGERGNLSLTFAEIARKYRPRWLVWENVPGVFSSNDGRDFASILGLLTGRSVTPPTNGWKNAGYLVGYENAYSLAWRVLDAQYVRVDGFPYAVPQRRRRVFLVGYSGNDYRYPAAVLFDRESVCWHFAPRRKTQSRIAANAEKSIGTNCSDNNVNEAVISVAAASSAKQDLTNHHVDTSHPLFVCTLGYSQSNGLGISNYGVANTLEATTSVNQAIAPIISLRDNRQYVVKTANNIATFDRQSNDEYGSNDVASTMNARDYKSPSDLVTHFRDVEPAQNNGRTIASDCSAIEKQSIASIRRLTPMECERLMGFPDNYTKIDAKTPDAPRYKALGNSMAVNCMRWIGRRIEQVNALIKRETAQ